MITCRYNASTANITTSVGYVLPLDVENPR